MQPSAEPPITDLLREWRAGRREALDRLIPLVYDELKRLARRHLRGERPDHTLQTAALVNEAFLRLVGAEVPWSDRNHFFAVAARTMRRVLVDYAKAQRRAKRSGGMRVTLSERLAAAEPSIDLVAVDRALDSLAAQDPRKVELLELHFFGGLTYDEMADVVGVSSATVHRELRLAKAWVSRSLAGPVR